MPTLLGPELEAKDGELKIPGAVSDLDRAAAALDTLTDSVNNLQAEVKKGETEATDTEAETKPAEAETQEDKDVNKADDAKDASDKPEDKDAKADQAKNDQAKADEAEDKDKESEEAKAEGETETAKAEEDKAEEKAEESTDAETKSDDGVTKQEGEAAESDKEEAKEEAKEDDVNKGEEDKEGKETKEETEAVTEELTEKAVWTTAYINDLPDSAFLFIESDGKKDGEGKTVPRSKRHFPVKDASGKLDLPHLRNAIARIPQSNAPGLDDTKKKALQEKARKMLAQAQKSDTQKDEEGKVNTDALADVFKGVARDALSLAGSISANGLPDDLRASLVEMKKSVQGVVESCEIAKSEDSLLPEVFTKEEIDTDELAKAFADTILGVAGRSSAVSSFTGESLTDQVRKEISEVLGIVESLEEKAPVVAEKSSRVMYESLVDVMSRADKLVEEAEGKDGQAMRDVKHLQTLLKAMDQKYATSETDLDFGDYGLVMDADRNLSKLEESLVEKGEETASADTPETKADGADVAKQDTEKALTDRIEALTGQVNELKAVVAKARNMLPPPGSQDEARVGEQDANVLFPADYNSPEHRGATKEQEGGAQETKLY